MSETRERPVISGFSADEIEIMSYEVAREVDCLDDRPDAMTRLYVAQRRDLAEKIRQASLNAGPYGEPFDILRKSLETERRLTMEHKGTIEIQANRIEEQRIAKNAMLHDLDTERSASANHRSRIEELVRENELLSSMLRSGSAPLGPGQTFPLCTKYLGPLRAVPICSECKRAQPIIVEYEDQIRMLTADLDVARRRFAALAEDATLCASLRRDLKAEQIARSAGEDRNRDLCAEIITLKAELAERTGYSYGPLNEELALHELVLPGSPYLVDEAVAQLKRYRTVGTNSKLSKAIGALRHITDRAQSIRDIAKDGME